MMQNIIVINKTQYKITNQERMDHLGTRFFGKSRFDLENVDTGERFCWFGKKLTANSKLERAK